MADDENSSLNEETKTQETALDPQRRQEIMSYRKHLWDSLFSSYGEFDRAILTLSSALLAVSIAFAKDIVPIEDISLPELLVASWILFGIAILLTLTSFQTSQQAFRDQIAQTEKYIETLDREDLTKRSRWSKITERLNFLSTCAFVIAVLLMILFASYNLIGVASL